MPDPIVEPPANPDPIKVDNNLPPPTYTPPDIKMAEALPPEFRDKPFFKDKSFVDVMKDHVNLQTLLGQRPAGIPKDDAPQEEWDKLLGALRPKDINEYGFPETDFSKAGKRNPGYETALRNMANEVGVSKKMFPKFVEMVETHLAGADKISATQTAEATKARETEFEGLLDKTYAGEKQAVIDRTKKLMLESVDPSMKERVGAALKDISNENLFVLTSVLDGVYKKYIAEDRPPGGNNNAGADAAALHAEMQALQGSAAYKDFRIAGHDAAKQRVQDLAKQISLMQK